MNVFTKDELLDLIFCVKDHTAYQGDSIHDNLIQKIQSMIDNYCEHELCDIDYDYQPIRCRNCKEIVE
jgi:hypothetical protein